MQSASEYATWQFYDWERLGRGWLLCEKPIHLEPTFYPFFHHGLPVSTVTKDDGGGHLFSKLLGAFKKKKPLEIAEPEESIFIPYLLEKDEPKVIYRLSIPRSAKVEVQETLELLVMLSDTSYPVSFEIISAKGRITIQMVCRESDAALVSSQVRSYFPECTVQKKEDKLLETINLLGEVVASEFALTGEFMLPLAMADSFKFDPHIGLFAALETLEHNESAIIQVMFQGVVNPWAESIMRSVTDSEGGAFFADAPEMVKLAREKVSEPLFAVVTRCIVLSTTGDRAFNAEERIAKAVCRMCASPHNSFINTGIKIDYTEFGQDMVDRRTHRHGVLLNYERVSDPCTSSQCLRYNTKHRA